MFIAIGILILLIAVINYMNLSTARSAARVKEIGIRKVLGASSWNVAHLLSKDFLKLVVLANVIAWPLAWYFMNRWLEDFANRVQISWWVFLSAGLVAILIALITVGWKAIKAAIVNPVKNIRTE